MYDIENESIHCFDPKENPKEMVERIKKKLIKDLKKCQNEFKEIFKMKKIKKITYKK